MRQLTWIAICLAALAALSGCDDNGVTAGPEDRIDIFANPEDVTIDIASGQDRGTTTIIAQLFDSGGYAGSGVNVYFSANGGILHTACTSGACAVVGGICAEDTDCLLPGTQPVVADAHGFATVFLTLRTTDPDPTTVTAASGSINNTVAVGKIEDTGNLPPVAAIQIDPADGARIGEPVIFDGSASDDSDGQIYCYQWEITSSVSQSNEIVQGTSARQFSRSYPDEQRLSVILRVSDDPASQAVCAPVPPGAPADTNLFNGSDSVSYDIVCDPSPPVADAGTAQTVTLSGGQAQAFLNGSGSTDPQSGIVSYDWDCRNGTSASGQQATCTYTQTGVRDVVLVVTNGCGDTDSDTVRITVTAP